jgi:hypothetical protein
VLLIQEGSTGSGSVYPQFGLRWDADCQDPAVPRRFRDLLSQYTFDEVKSKLGIDTMEELGILRLALLTKGTQFNLSQLLVRYNNQNRPPVPIIRHMVSRLAKLGFGTVQMNGRVMKFQKIEPEEIDEQLLLFCGVNLEQYSAKYYVQNKHVSLPMPYASSNELHSP